MRRASCAMVAALMLGCSDAGLLPTDEIDQGAAPSFRAQLTRSDVSITFSDPSTSLLAVVGLEEGATLTDFCSGTAGNFPGSEAFIVEPPPGGFLVGNAGGQDVPVLIYEFDGQGDICELGEEALIASGTAHFRYSELHTPGAAEAFKAVIRGTLDLESGG